MAATFSSANINWSAKIWGEHGPPGPPGSGSPAPGFERRSPGCRSLAVPFPGQCFSCPSKSKKEKKRKLQKIPNKVETN